MNKNKQYMRQGRKVFISQKEYKSTTLFPNNEIRVLTVYDFFVDISSQN